MLIRLDNGKSINVVEQCLVVRKGMLFNTDTNQYEALDGDQVECYFTNNLGHQCWVRGTVDGYTCHRRIKLQDSKDLYAASLNSTKVIDHKSKIFGGNFEPYEEKEEVLEDYLAAVLCAQ